jgi:hypothetical protein
VVECPPSKCEALSSSPSSTKKKKRERERENDLEMHVMGRRNHSVEYYEGLVRRQVIFVGFLAFHSVYGSFYANLLTSGERARRYIYG